MPHHRQLQIPRRTAPRRNAGPEAPSLAKAEAELRQVFGSRPRPYNVQYCTHCFEPREMAEVLITKPEQLAAERLESVVFNAYWTWGDWPSLAHYVPRLLALHTRGELSDAEMLFYKLLLAARPELLTTGSAPEQVRNVLGEVMRPEERRAIFEFVRSVADGAMADPDLSLGVDRVREAFSFLAAFAAPISPVVEAWKGSRNGVVRGRYCVFLAEWALRYDPAARVLEQTYLDRLSPHRGNVWALIRLVEPSAVEAYLSAHLPEVEPFDADLQSTVGVALDWARCAQRGEESPLARQWKDVWL